MTIKSGPPKSSRSRKRPAGPGRWRLADAKARFSELVRRAKSEGAQIVTVKGQDEVVVVEASEFRRLTGKPTGRVLVEAFAQSPHHDVEIEPSRRPMPVRDVPL